MSSPQTPGRNRGRLPNSDLTRKFTPYCRPDLRKVSLGDDSTEVEQITNGGTQINLEAELKQAVKDGTLPVKDPLTFGPHTYPFGAALQRALVAVADLAAFVADRGLNIRFQFNIDEDGGTTTFIATQAEYEEIVADKKTKREARQARGHYTMYEAAEVLSAVSGREAKAFLNERMVPAANTGALVVLNPVDGGPVIGRACRRYDDWATPANINDWLARDRFDYLWTIVANEPQTVPKGAISASDGLKPTNKAKIVADIQSVDARPLRGQSSEGDVPTAPVFSMTKAAMIAQHKRQWPSIERDMSDAKRNGLHIAKAGSRGWWEVKALAWAKANNKLLDAEKPAALLAQAMSSMANLPGKKVAF